MALEIERKFLVQSGGWRGRGEAIPIHQGYLAFGPPTAIRVRIAGNTAHVNLKQATTDIVRREFEYPIPLDDAEEILAHCCTGHLIEKTRHKVAFSGQTWEVDEFAGVNAGLVVAEIELEAVDQPFERPPWVGKEVSGDPRYLNTHLASTPFITWP